MRVRTVVNFLACLLFIYILCVYGPRVFEIHLSIYLSIYLSVVYSQVLCSSKNIIFISISIHRLDTGTQLQWQVTNMACNDLRARGAWGHDAPPSPPPPKAIYLYIYK